MNKNLQVFLPWLKLDVLFFLQNNKNLFSNDALWLFLPSLLPRSLQRNQIPSNPAVRLDQHSTQCLYYPTFSTPSAKGSGRRGWRGRVCCYSSRPLSQSSFLTPLGSADLRQALPCRSQQKPSEMTSFNDKELIVLHAFPRLNKHSLMMSTESDSFAPRPGYCFYFAT